MSITSVGDSSIHVIHASPHTNAVSLRVFESRKHYAWYQSLINQEPHGATDFYSNEELRELIKAREVEAWVAHSPAGPVGWCAVTLRSPHHPLQEAVHFLGAIVDQPYRQQGFGSAMVAARLELFPTRPITASVVPGNIPSERMLRAAGFRPGLMQEPWCTWHRPSHHHPMVLLDPNEHSATINEFLHRRIYAERETMPVEGGHGRIDRGLWPDEAAFHSVPRRLSDSR